MAQNCNNCKKENEEMTMVTMSGANWEKNEERHSREKKRLWITILVLIGALVASNLAWIIYENSFDDVITTEEIIVDADDNGNANYIGQDGNIYNGEDNSKENNKNP